MARTFSALQHQIISSLQGVHGDPALHFRVKEWINQARDEFLSAASWYFMAVNTGSVTLVAGTKEYSLPSDYDKINDSEVRTGTNKKKVWYLNDKDFDLVVMNPTVQGSWSVGAIYFTLTGFQKIQFYPIPNSAAVTNEATVGFEYFKKPSAQLVADTDTLGIPDKYEPIILHKATGYALAANSKDGSMEFALSDTGLKLAFYDNRKIVEIGQTDLIPNQPGDQRQSAGTDQRRMQ
jgi:hypothetical protein